MKEDNKQKKEQKILSPKSIKLCISAVCVIAVIIIGIVIVSSFGKKEEPEIVTTSTLKKIINVSDLSTFEAVYNGVAKVNNEKKPEEIDYYVSYEAKVKAGIDFEKIEIEVDNERKKISIALPEIKINEVNVEMETLDYIFVNQKANNSTVSAQAYKKCIEDVEMESSSEQAIYDLAEQNAKNTIEGLIKPFVEQLDEEYDLVIK